MPVDVRLSFQGGGAKVGALIAVAEVLRELHDAGKLRVTHVAGTSAGAIAAAALADRQVSIPDVRKRLQNMSDDEWSKVFPRFRATGALARLAFNRPILSLVRLEELLREFFEDRAFHDLEIPCRVVAANVSRARRVLLDGAESVAPSVATSCALPFVFRTGSSDHEVIVDGGLYENLPGDDVSDEAEGRSIGICFRPNPERAERGNLLSFARSLLDTAMTSSLDKTLGGMDEILWIDTDIKTFEFERLRDDGLGDQYDRIKGDAEAFFRNVLEVWADDDRYTVPSVSLEPYQEFLEAGGKIWVAQHQRKPLEFLDHTIEVTAQSVARPGGADEVVQTTRFRTADEECQCFCLRLTSTGAAMAQSFQCTVLDESNGKARRIPWTWLPINASMADYDSVAREFLLFFLEPLPARSGPYRITFADSVKDGLADFREGRSDFLGSLCRRDSTAPYETRIILYLPNDCPRPGLDQDSGRSSDTEYVAGEAMDEDELASHAGLKAGFYAVGWKGRLERAGQRLAVRFDPAPGPPGGKARGAAADTG